MQPADLSPDFIPVNGPGRPERESVTARYRRLASETTEGPVTVESRAHVLDSSDAADEELETARADVGDSQPIGEPGLGDESFAATRAHSGVRYYGVYWRDSNVTASLAVNGVEGRFPFSDALELARKQEERIARQR